MLSQSKIDQIDSKIKENVIIITNRQEIEMKFRNKEDIVKNEI